MVKVAEHIKKLVPYNPGKPIEELEREKGIKAIKLASNENPLGPSPKAVEAIRRAAEKVHRYPEGGCYYLRKKLSAFLGVGEENLVFGNGSNEIIEILMRTFLAPGDEVVYAWPAFVVYKLISQAMGLSAREIPLKDMRHDLEAMADAVTDRTKMVFVANPNNPTGTAVYTDEVERFLERIPDDVIVVFDEAYYEFADQKRFPQLKDRAVEGYKNLVLMRTFSKAYGLAGLRMGYCITSPEIADYMNRVRQPFNVNLLAQEAAIAALEDQEHVKKTVELANEGKAYFYSEFEKMGLEYVPSETNFVLVKVGDGRRVFEGLLDRGVIVRSMEGYSLPEYIRVNVGLVEENERFIKELKALLS
ncbi:MAG: histidinol-phosphate transaminase [Deferribacteres bacterium]|nr:histidinol-phosphate transaminase [Deferribacteres bacterium]